MRKGNVILILTALVWGILLSGCDRKEDADNTPTSEYTQNTQSIEIKEVFSRLITRDENDRIYSGQIKTEAGLDEFEAAYGITIDRTQVNFNNHMLIFGITDQISTRAISFLYNTKTRSYTLEYIDTGIEYKLRPPGEGQKHSYLQVFVTKKIDNIPHLKVKNLIHNGLSEIYDN